MIDTHTYHFTENWAHFNFEIIHESATLSRTVGSVKLEQHIAIEAALIVAEGQNVLQPAHCNGK